MKRWTMITMMIVLNAFRDFGFGSTGTQIRLTVKQNRCVCALNAYLIAVYIWYRAPFTRCFIYNSQYNFYHSEKESNTCGMWIVWITEMYHLTYAHATCHMPYAAYTTYSVLLAVFQDLAHSTYYIYCDSNLNASTINIIPITIRSANIENCCNSNSSAIRIVYPNVLWIFIFLENSG